jgi:hypothetical protein
VADHAHAGVVGEHPLELLRGELGAVGDDDHAGVDRVADADAAAVVDRHPGRAGRVLTSALSSGQSAIASEPSRIASVSRYGEATEPQSRWSRPITIGALRLARCDQLVERAARPGARSP